MTRRWGWVAEVLGREAIAALGRVATEGVRRSGGTVLAPDEIAALIDSPEAFARFLAQTWPRVDPAGWGRQVLEHVAERARAEAWPLERRLLAVGEALAAASAGALYARRKVPK